MPSRLGTSEGLVLGLYILAPPPLVLGTVK